DGDIATVTLSNPGRMNALDLAMWERLGLLAKELQNDESLRCVVVRGAGEKAFAAGADIAAFATERANSRQAKEYGRRIAAAMHSFAACRHPVVALIQGACVGGGLLVASQCALRICNGTARRLPRAGTRSSCAGSPMRGRFRKPNTTRATPASTPRTSGRAWLPSLPSASRNSRAASRLDDARGAQPRNLGIALAEEAAQHFIGVLAEQGRREPILDSRHGEAHGARDARQLACGRMVQLDPDAAGPDLRL